MSKFFYLVQLLLILKNLTDILFEQCKITVLVGQVQCYGLNCMDRNNILPHSIATEIEALTM